MYAQSSRGGFSISGLTSRMGTVYTDIVRREALYNILIEFGIFMNLGQLKFV